MTPFCAVILAAGRAERFGSPKALMTVRGVSAVERIAGTARRAGAADVIVVTGHHRDRVAPALAGVMAREVVNVAPDRGMMSSVRVGLAAVPNGHSALVWPVDHPFVGEATVRLVAAALPKAAIEPGGADLAGEAPIVVPMFGGRGGHPVLLPADLLALALTLDDSGGLDRLLVAAASRVVRLAVDDPGVLANINRPSDLANH